MPATAEVTAARAQLSHLSVVVGYAVSGAAMSVSVQEAMQMLPGYIDAHDRARPASRKKGAVQPLPCSGDDASLLVNVYARVCAGSEADGRQAVQKHVSD